MGNPVLSKLQHQAIRISAKVAATSRIVKLVVLLLLLVFFNLTGIFPLKAQALPTHMFALWDPSFGSTPSGWTVITTYDGRFPRGDTVANVLTTGANDTPRTPTTASVTVDPPTQIVPAPGTGAFGAADTHTHPAPTVTVGADSNSDLPAYRSLQLIEYSTGIPTFIPGGAIVMFDTNGSIPAGFTRISAQDSKMIRVNSTVATGGSDTANNTVAVGALASSTSSFDAKSQSTNAVAQETHGHAAAAGGSTTAVSTLPPYVQPQLAQANADTSSIPVALVTMFDGDPGVGWQVVSGSGGAYNQQFLRPASTASLTSLGSLTHTPPTYSVQSGLPTTSSLFNTRTNGGGAGVALQAHTHLITVTFNATSNIPPYFSVVIAQKVSFTLQAYRWYIDVNSENTTDPWPTGGLNIAQTTAIPTIPAAYKPPGIGTQLRLRIQMLVSGQALPTSSIQFKLEFKQGTDSSCITGSWTDFGSAAAWNYGTNTVTDNTTLSASQLSPTSSILELFNKSAPSAVNPSAVATGQTMEYDFLIKDLAANGATQYSIRPVEASGNPLSQYSQCPTLTTIPSTSQQLRHGDFFQNGVKAGFEWAD